MLCIKETPKFHAKRYTSQKVIATDAAGNTGSDVSNGTFTIGQNCYLRPVAGFDVNNDGVLSLVDVALVINSLRTGMNESSIELVKERIESMLIAIFSDSPSQLSD